MIAPYQTLAQYAEETLDGARASHFLEDFRVEDCPRYWRSLDQSIWLYEMEDGSLLLVDARDPLDYAVAALEYDGVSHDQCYYASVVGEVAFRYYDESSEPIVVYRIPHEAFFPLIPEHHDND